MCPPKLAYNFRELRLRIFILISKKERSSSLQINLVSLWAPEQLEHLAHGKHSLNISQYYPYSFPFFSLWALALSTYPLSTMHRGPIGILKLSFYF